MKIPAITILWLFLIFSPALSFAEIVKLTSATGKTIVADFAQGTNNAGPVLLLHGFLQTSKFSTVNRLMVSLADSDYTVLNPTLSLGLSNRQKSLPCEAIHLHSLDSDAEELGQWIEWLYNKTGKPVTVIGHSAGGPVILKYMDSSKAEYINHSILISLLYYGSGAVSNENEGHAKRALKARSDGSNPLETYALGYCKTYPTTAEAFLSYYNWNKTRTNSTVNKFSDRISIIIGTGDKRMSQDWMLQLLKKKNVFAVKGANHFFDQAHEFELTDIIEKLLFEYAGQ